MCSFSAYTGILTLDLLANINEFGTSVKLSNVDNGNDYSCDIPK